MSHCVCRSPGFCERHKCQKSEHWHHLCQTRIDYFELWEGGKGPCLKAAGVSRPLDDCPHRGEQIRTATCNVCGYEKGQSFAVLACGLYGECSLERMRTGIRSCRACLLKDENTPHEAGVVEVTDER